jgi:hypothetical protein
MAERRSLMNYGERFWFRPGSKVKWDDIVPNFTGKHENQKSSWPKLESVVGFAGAGKVGGDLDPP